MMVGLVAAVCMFGVLTASASAKKITEPVVFGKFVASLPGGTISPEHPAKAAGIGEMGESKIGPLEFEECEKELKSKAMVTSESSEEFTTEIIFKKCPFKFQKDNSGAEVHKASFKLDITFHSNGSTEIGEGSEGEAEIAASSIPIKIQKSFCNGVIKIPSQTIPFRAVKNPEVEFESASYGTEHETVSGGKLKKFPSGFQEKLDVEWEFKKVNAEATPTANCPLEGGTFNPETKMVEWKTGTMEGELEEITISGGNLGFAPKV
jgi:hypothetical protein